MRRVLLTAALVGATVLGCSTAPTPTPAPQQSPSAMIVAAPRIVCDREVDIPPDTLGCRDAVAAALAAIPPGRGPILMAHFVSYSGPKCAPLGPCVTESNTGYVDLVPSSGGLQRVNLTKAADGTISTGLWLFVPAIPWTDTIPTPEPSPTAMTIPPGTPPCGPGDVQATASWQGATGSMAGGIGLKNVGTSTCFIDGPPALVQLYSGDALLPVEYKAVDRPGLGAGGIPGPALLHPGDEAAADLVWSNWCGVMIPVVTRVVVALPGRGQLSAHPPEHPGVIGPGPGFGGTPRCDSPGAPSSLVATAFSYTPPQPPEPQNLPASVEIAAPPMAAAGAELSFTVLLTNLGSSDARLDPCPVYTEDLVVGGAAIKPPAAQRCVLNCAAIGGFIAPGRTVPLTMGYEVPENVSGSVTFGWFIEPGGPFDSNTDSAQTAVTIEGP